MTKAHKTRYRDSFSRRHYMRKWKNSIGLPRKKKKKVRAKIIKDCPNVLEFLKYRIVRNEEGKIICFY